MKVITAAAFKSNTPQEGRKGDEKESPEEVHTESLSPNGKQHLQGMKVFSYSRPKICICFRRGPPGFLTVLSLTQMNWVNQAPKTGMIFKL